MLTPDWVKTAKQLAGEDGYKGYLQGVADEHATMKRFATPEELAHFFVFLCSDKATYSIGSTYFVDGGMLKTVYRAFPENLAPLNGPTAILGSILLTRKGCDGRQPRSERSSSSWTRRVSPATRRRSGMWAG